MNYYHSQKVKKTNVIYSTHNTSNGIINFINTFNVDVENVVIKFSNDQETNANLSVENSIISTLANKESINYVTNFKARECKTINYTLTGCPLKVSLTTTYNKNKVILYNSILPLSTNIKIVKNSNRNKNEMTFNFLGKKPILKNPNIDISPAKIPSFNFNTSLDDINDDIQFSLQSDNMQSSLISDNVQSDDNMQYSLQSDDNMQYSLQSDDNMQSSLQSDDSLQSSLQSDDSLQSKNIFTKIVQKTLLTDIPRLDKIGNTPIKKSKNLFQQKINNFILKNSGFNNIKKELPKLEHVVIDKQSLLEDIIAPKKELPKLEHVVIDKQSLLEDNILTNIKDTIIDTISSSINSIFSQNNNIAINCNQSKTQTYDNINVSIKVSPTQIIFTNNSITIVKLNNFVFLAGDEKAFLIMQKDHIISYTMCKDYVVQLNISIPAKSSIAYDYTLISNSYIKLILNFAKFQQSIKLYSIYGYSQMLNDKYFTIVNNSDLVANSDIIIRELSDGNKIQSYKISIPTRNFITFTYKSDKYQSYILPQLKLAGYFQKADNKFDILLTSNDNLLNIINVSNNTIQLNSLNFIVPNIMQNIVTLNNQSVDKIMYPLTCTLQSGHMIQYDINAKDEIVYNVTYEELKHTLNIYLFK